MNLEKESSEHFKRTQLEHEQHCTDLPRQVTFPAHTEQEKTGQGLGLNVAAHQKEKNQKTAKRKAGEERRQADFKKAACYPSAVVQGAARQKMVCVSNWDLREGHSHFGPAQTGWGPHHHAEAAVDWCSSILLALHVFRVLYIGQKFCTSLSKMIGVNTCFGDRQKVRNDD